jgi:hypothetical protein
VALGYSKFCDLFTQEEWEGYEYYVGMFPQIILAELGSDLYLQILVSALSGQLAARVTNNFIVNKDFWYSSGPGNPATAAQGLGYVQELVSRLTHTPINVWNSSTNSTLDSNNITFPLNQPIYVDATHDTVISSSMLPFHLQCQTTDGRAQSSLL